MQYNFSIDEKIVTFDSNSIGITEFGHAFLYDQEGALHVVVRNWDWVVLTESTPEVK